MEGKGYAWEDLEIGQQVLIENIRCPMKCGHQADRYNLYIDENGIISIMYFCEEECETPRVDLMKAPMPNDSRFDPDHHHLKVEDVLVEPTSDMLKYADFAKKIARKVFGIDIEVKFAEWPDTEGVKYSNRTLILNLKVVPKEFFESLSLPLLDLTIHKLAHESDNNTDYTYLQACTQLGAALTMIALTEPGFFGVEISRLEI